MIKVLLVDDEPLAHQVLIHHLKKHADFNVVGQCFNATEALAWLANQQADVIFLDINMPALSGIEMLKVLANRPQVVIVSAYQEYALQGFELDVTDYLLKPVSAQRFALAIEKLLKRSQLASKASQTHVVVKVDREQRKVVLADITQLEAYGNYVKLWCGSNMTLVSSTLKQLLQQLPSTQFVQVHKSFVVNKAHVLGVESEHVRLSDQSRVKIGRAYRVNSSNLLS